MDLRRLEVFAKVAELGSFSRAADALSLTQPTVSEHVRTLEDEIGVQLLDRLGRGATPTHAGRLLLGYARRMLALQREAQQALDQFQGRMSGEADCSRESGAFINGSARELSEGANMVRIFRAMNFIPLGTLKRELQPAGWVIPVGVSTFRLSLDTVRRGIKCIAPLRHLPHA